jgi:hypothetical protein
MKIIFLIYLLVAHTIAIRPSDLCKNVQLECKGVYKTNLRYALNCGMTKCEDRNHKYKCNQMYCSVDMKTCEEYKNKIRSAASMLKLTQPNEKLTLFNQKIKDCNVKEYKLNKQDVCKIGKNCILVEKGKKNSKVYSLYSIKDITCPCKGKHSYQCGNEYCTVNNIVCDKLMSNQTMKIKYKDCFNGDQTIKNI